MNFFGMRISNWWIFLFILIILSMFFTSCGFSVGHGKQAGIISEVERNGIFWRPPVVRLLNIQPTYSQKDTSYDYAASEEMANLAESYMQNNTKVTVYYETKYFIWAWDYSSRTIITKIEPITVENLSKVQVI